MILFVLAGCGPGGPLTATLWPGVRRPAVGAVLFICDGLSIELVEQGCREGWLPNIEKRFMRGGTRVRNAVGCAPTITYPTLVTFATGAEPSRHRIVDNRWFDRRARLFRDYGFANTYQAVNGDFTLPTLYERIQPAASISIQSAVMRGVTHNIANAAFSGICWFFGNYTAVDKMTASTVAEAAAWANWNGRWPTVLTCYFPGVDAIGHHMSCDSPKYRWAVEHFDHQVGRVCDWLETQGLLETTHLVLTSDHGQTPLRADGRIPFMDQVKKEWNWRATDRPFGQTGAEGPRRRYFDQFNTVVIHDGPRLVTLHFAGADGWDSPPSPAAVQQLLETPANGRRLWDLPGIDLIAYAASDQETVLRAARGTARILERGDDKRREFCYVPGPEDVLGYLKDPALAAFVAAGFHSSREWLHATAAQAYPDLVPHLGPLLRTPRSGQALVFAAAGFGFGDERAGHGGLLRAEMRIPLFFAGPGIPAGGTLDAARAADVMPTLLTLLGFDLPQDGSLDGEPLFPVARTTGVQ